MPKTIPQRLTIHPQTQLKPIALLILLHKTTPTPHFLTIPLKMIPQLPMILPHQLLSVRSAPKNTTSLLNQSAHPAKQLIKIAYPALQTSLLSVLNVHKPIISTKTLHAQNAHKIAKPVEVLTFVTSVQKAIIWYKVKNNILVVV